MNEQMKYVWSEEHHCFTPECSKYILLEGLAIEGESGEPVMARSSLISENSQYVCGVGDTADDAVRDLMADPEFQTLVEIEESSDNE